jgi:hypothetical protein
MDVNTTIVATKKKSNSKRVLTERQECKREKRKLKIQRNNTSPLLSSLLPPAHFKASTLDDRQNSFSSQGEEDDDDLDECITQSPQFTLVPFDSKNNVAAKTASIPLFPPCKPASDEFSRCIKCFKNADDSTTLLVPIESCSACPNKHLVHPECIPKSFDNALRSGLICEACNGAAPVPYHVLATTTKSIILKNIDMADELEKGKAFITFLQDEKNRIQCQVRERIKALQEREQHQKWQQDNTDKRRAVLVKQEQELKAAEAVSVANTQMLQIQMRCCDQRQLTCDADIRNAAQVKAKYSGLMSAAASELIRLKRGCPQIGAPKVTKKYGKNACVFCGYYYISTMSCGVCTTKYMEGYKQLI